MGAAKAAGFRVDSFAPLALHHDPVSPPRTEMCETDGRFAPSLRRVWPHVSLGRGCGGGVLKGAPRKVQEGWQMWPESEGDLHCFRGPLPLGQKKVARSVRCLHSLQCPGNTEYIGAAPYCVQGGEKGKVGWRR